VLAFGIVAAFVTSRSPEAERSANTGGSSATQSELHSDFVTSSKEPLGMISEYGLHETVERAEGWGVMAGEPAGGSLQRCG
jgi:hypothetical protein